MATEKVIPTAWFTAYSRTFSDIPLSKEIFDFLEKSIKDSGEVIPGFVKDTRLAPQFEARHKLVDRLVKQSGINQIIEIAAGLSPRGFEMSKDPKIIYIETDFEKPNKEKQIMLDQIAGELPPNLYFEGVDALNFSDLENATRHFDPKKPIAIVHEGLLRYLSFDEKAVVAENIKKLLKKFGGVWITPDISKKRIVQNTEVVAHGLRDKMNEITGINIDNNLFDDEEHAVRFFEDLGFTIERHSFMEIYDNLVSPKNLNIPDDIVKILLNNAQVFIMKIKS